MRFAVLVERTPHIPHVNSPQTLFADFRMRSGAIVAKCSAQYPRI
jgi:hypothetical protein